MSSDPFEDVLSLEEQYYQQGYQQGYEDGVQAGKIEGRSVGLKKGYEKFFEAGRLQGKAMIWANRIPGLHQPNLEAHRSQPGQAEPGKEKEEPRLSSLNTNPRLEKHVTSLYALVEPGTLSTENTDEAVNDFDDRFKRAEGKQKVIERMIGPDHHKTSAAHEPHGVARYDI